MNRSIIALLMGLFCLSAAAQTNLSITATVTLTNNVSGATNGQSIVVNGQVRTWTNSVSTYSSQIQAATNVIQAATNIYDGFAISPQAQTILGWNYTNAITVQSFPGYPMTVTITGNWATVSFSTNVLTFATVVRVPVAAVGLSEQTNVASGLAAWLDNAYSTNQIHENAPSMQNFVGNTNSQTLIGVKIFTNASGQWFGFVTNSPGISGNAIVLSNGLYRSPILDGPTVTNLIGYGNLSSSNILATGKLVIQGTNGTWVAQTVGAGGIFDLFNGSDYFFLQPGAWVFNSSGGILFYTGTGFDVSASSSIGLTNGAGASLFFNNQAFTLAGANFYGSATVTNEQHQGQATYPAGSDVAYQRATLSSLATGNNAGVPIGTNVFLEVSGPGGAFTINGMTGGRDGKVLTIINQTSYNMTIANESGVDPAATNRIKTMTGSDLALTGGTNAVTFWYNANVSRWFVIGHQP